MFIVALKFLYALYFYSLLPKGEIYIFPLCLSLHEERLLNKKFFTFIANMGRELALATTVVSTGSPFRKIIVSKSIKIL